MRRKAPNPTIQMPTLWYRNENTVFRSRIKGRNYTSADTTEAYKQFESTIITAQYPNGVEYRVMQV